MSTIYGVPLIGPFVIPAVIGVVTVFLLWNCVISKKHIQVHITESELQGYREGDLPAKLQDKISSKRVKKRCGEKKKCCGSKKNKSGSCSSKTSTVKSLKVVLERRSNLCQEFSEILSKYFLEANLTCTFLPLSTWDVQLLLQNEDEENTLWAFVLDESSNNELSSLLEVHVNSPSVQSKPLSGKKYAVYSTGGQECSEPNNPVPADRLLHKLGAIRLCKAGVGVASGSLATGNFEIWACELLDRVLKWNEPKNKVCKCGPENGKAGSDKGSCSGSSSCSESDVDGLGVDKVDLEDIGHILNPEKNG